MRNIFQNPDKLILLIGLLLAGCGKKYDHTVKVCGGSLYVEIYDIGKTISAHYLTDTTNFRLFVGKYDNERENFSYRCNGDTLEILKIEAATHPGGNRKVSGSRKYSIAGLKKNNAFE